MPRQVGDFLVVIVFRGSAFQFDSFLLHIMPVSRGHSVVQDLAIGDRAQMGIS